MKLENNRKHFFQWDAGCRLLLEEDANRVDFTLMDSNEIYSVLPEEGTVRVPDVCLRASGMLEVYAVREDTSGRQTMKCFSFPVIPRQKPSDYVYTPEEYASYYKLSAKVDGKLTTPDGGEPGQVLTKTALGYDWTFSGGNGAGTTFYPQISPEGILTWTNELGLPNPDPVDLKGGVGEDGFTPTISVEAVEEGLLLTITNRDGVNEIILPKGVAGGEGQSGATFTPHMSDDGILSWTNDKGLTNPVSICLRGNDGAPGQPGEPGIPGAVGPAGQTGPAGADGYSPRKGVDYFTQEDISEIRRGLLSADGGTLNGTLDLNGNAVKNISMPSDLTDAVNKEYADGARMIFHGISIPKSAFVQDSTYEDFGFKADIPLEGAMATYIPEVIFDVVPFSYAPISRSYNGGVSVYTDEIPETTVTIPTIILWRGDGV